MNDRYENDANSADDKQSLLYDRTVPSGVYVDAVGLIDAWVIETENWLIEYAGLTQLTPREAFEGIKCLMRLTRCRSEICQREDVVLVRRKLADTIAGADACRFAETALTFPAVGDWRQRAENAWDSDNDDSPELMERLLTDLDALDGLIWFSHGHISEPETHSTLQQLTTHWALLHQWFHKHLVMFAAAEGYIRAVGKTLAEEIRDDTGGWLTMSCWKYASLLDELERSWQDTVGPPSFEWVMNIRPFGRKQLDWKGIPELAHFAGATIKHEAPRKRIRWVDPTGEREAITHLPNYRMPGVQMRLQVMFGMGNGFAFPPIELIGKTVRLGNAEATIVSQGDADDLLVLAEVNFEEVIRDLKGDIELQVDGRDWR
jgi:hypothetical protein